MTVTIREASDSPSRSYEFDSRASAVAFYKHLLSVRGLLIPGKGGSVAVVGQSGSIEFVHREPLTVW